MLRNFPAVYLLPILYTIIIVPAHAGVQRAYVASNGLNSNTSFNCDVTHPCQGFAAAATVVDPGGEVVALNSGAYGPVTVTKSISFTAAPGIYAGMTVFSVSTAGVSIPTSNINVVLRGLTINGLGGNNGILMTGDSNLSIENCVISNFTGFNKRGIFINSAATVRIVNTLVRNNDTGVELQGGATATISRSKFLDNGYGIFAAGATSTTTVAVSDTYVAGGDVGIIAFSQTTSAINRISVIRSTISNAFSFGISAEAHPNGTASVTLSKNMIVGNNSYGLFTLGGNPGSSASIKSLGNNTVTDNITEFNPGFPPTPMSPI